MNFSRPFILRPIATSLLMVALLVAGMLAWRLLPVAALPQVDYPVIQVQATLPGASPDTVARMITAPLERYLGQISGLKQMSSASGAGVSVITLQFALDSDLGVAEQDVQSALDNAESLLPDGMPAPPRYRKVNPADTPILTLAVSSKTLPLPQIHDLVDTRMAQKLAQVQGVGQVSLAGGQRPAIRVQADSAALKAAGLTLADVQKVIASANANLPKGSFDGPVRSTTLDANDQLTTVAQYEDLVVTWKNGVPLRVRDVATVVQGPEDRFLAAWADAERAILISVQRQPDANVIEVADRVRALLPRLTATLPASVDVRILTDRTESIRSSVRDVQVELVLAVGLVVLVTLVFLRSVRMTLIPAVVVPISLVATFAAMYLADYSLNNLSLMALTIATGFVVDDAIVMMENIARHREQGKPALQAALDGAKEIGFTLVSLTVSLVAVLIPLLFMGDVVGRLFHEFAVTLAVAIGISLLVSLTLTPMMSARMLKGETGHGGAEPSARPALLDRLIAAYGRSLDRVLDHQGLMLLVMLATLGLTVWLYLLVPKGFFPVQDSGVIQVVTQAPGTISFEAMKKQQEAVARQLLDDPDVASLSSFIGVDGSNTALNTGRMLLNLKSHEDRADDVLAIIDRLRRRMTERPEAERRTMGVWFQPVQELSIEDRISRAQYQMTLSTPDTALLAEWAPRAGRHRQRSAERRLAGLRGDRSHRRRPPGRAGADHHRGPAECLRAAADCHALHAVQPVPRGAGAGSGAGPGHGGAGPCVRGGFRRHAGGAFRSGTLEQPQGAGGGEPSVAVPGGHAVLQPGQRPFAGGCGGRRGRGAAAAGLAAVHREPLPGGGRGVPGIAVEHAVAGAGRRGGDVPGAGHPVRECHSPHHHPVHAALGHGGGAVGAARQRPGAGHGGRHRHRAAHWPGEEERHHDGGLRAGGRAS